MKIKEWALWSLPFSEAFLKNNKKTYTEHFTYNNLQNSHNNPMRKVVWFSWFLMRELRFRDRNLIKIKQASTWKIPGLSLGNGLFLAQQGISTTRTPCIKWKFSVHFLHDSSIPNTHRYTQFLLEITFLLSLFKLMYISLP